MAVSRYDPALKKRLGQHHLIRSEACGPLIEFLRPRGERVLEIGPGGGVLTGALAAAGARIDALEIDLEWALRLPRKLPEAALSVVVADALTLELGRWPPGTLAAGNLAYGMATALIGCLLPHHQVFPRAAFLVQREVAERLLAAPGTAAYGALTVLVAARSRVSRLGRVRRGAFRPPPKVEGAFVGFELQPPVLAETEMGPFTEAVHLAFANRRKTLRNSLAGRWGRVRAERVLAAAGIPPSTRAQELDLEGFLALMAAASPL